MQTIHTNLSSLFGQRELSSAQGALGQHDYQDRDIKAL